MNRPKVERIWSTSFFDKACFSLWEGHLEWMHRNGFARALDRVPQTEPFPASGHEVVDLLAEFIFQTGLVNAHLGLTSSDIVDNVRLMQIRHSLAVLDDSITDLGEHLTKMVEPMFGTKTQGYTHWQPAAQLDWEGRLFAWLKPLRICRQPRICAKQFGGPVGDAKSLRSFPDLGVPFDWKAFDLNSPQNNCPIQSSDHQCEQTAIAWVCQIAAQVHKVAADLRFLASHRQVSLVRAEGHAGSSSMPHKLNPYKWEKVCSICRSVSTTQAEMWSVAAHNGLERTLDTSWQIKQLLPRAFLGLVEALDLLSTTEFRAVQANRDRDQKFDSDAVLAQRVRLGESRWQAYTSMLKEYNPKS